MQRNFSFLSLIKDYWFTTLSTVVLLSGLTITTILVQHRQTVTSQAGNTEKRPWTYIHNWAIWLNNPRLEELEQSNFELIVIDYSLDKTAKGEFKRDEISKLKETKCNRRVLAYLNIAHAEAFRSYWQSSWRLQDPPWISLLDPARPQHFFVEFWNPSWHQILYGIIDAIIAHGFDGLYLADIDVYRQTYAQGHEEDMVNLIIALSQYARSSSPPGQDFGIVIQNAEELGIKYHALTTIVTGISKEAIYVKLSGEPVPNTELINTYLYLDQFKKNSQGKLVLTLDYTPSPNLIQYAYINSLEKGYTPYVTQQMKANLTISPGFEPICSPI